VLVGTEVTIRTISVPVRNPGREVVLEVVLHQRRAAAAAPPPPPPAPHESRSDSAGSSFPHAKRSAHEKSWIASLDT
jgi:hypothetical protein